MNRRLEQATEPWENLIPDSEWQWVRQWINLEKPELEKIDPNRMIYIKSRIGDHAKLITSQQRLRELRSIINQAYPIRARFLFVLALTILNALIYAFPIYDLTNKLDPLYSIPLTAFSSLTAGLATSLTVTRFFSTLSLHRYTSKTIEKHSPRGPIDNQLKSHFKETGLGLIWDMERNLTPGCQPTSYVLVAFLAVTVYLLTFHLLAQVVGPTEDSLPLLTVSATLPLILNWTISDLVGQAIELPKYCRNLITCYQNLYDSQIKHEGGMETENYCRDARLSEELKVIFSPDPIYPSPELAGLAFDIDHFNNKMLAAERNKRVEILKYERQHKEEIDLLWRNLGEISSEEIMCGVVEREKEKKMDLTRIEKAFDFEVNHFQKKVGMVQQSYNSLRDRWIRHYDVYGSRQDESQEVKRSEDHHVLEAEIFDGWKSDSEETSIL